MLACISSGALSIMPNDCIALPQAYNPHNHRPHGGSVQRGLSAAIAAAAGFDVCGAADKRYSVATREQLLPFRERAIMPHARYREANPSAVLAEQSAVRGRSGLHRSLARRSLESLVANPSRSESAVSVGQHP